MLATEISFRREGIVRPAAKRQIVHARVATEPPRALVMILEQRNLAAALPALIDEGAAVVV
ncbi:MAG: hypothetical protein ABW217_16035, partial [Polyangiaceae bacterium]